MKGFEIVLPEYLEEIRDYRIDQEVSPESTVDVIANHAVVSEQPEVLRQVVLGIVKNASNSLTHFTPLASPCMILILITWAATLSKSAFWLTDLT